MWPARNARDRVFRPRFLGYLNDRLVRRKCMKTPLVVLSTFVLVYTAGLPIWALAAPDAGVSAASAASSCDRKCAEKKHGEKMVALHRKGWEAAIAELGIVGAEKTKLLDLAKKTEDRMKKAYASGSNSELDKAKVDAIRELKKLLQDRFQWWQDAEYKARESIITAETGARPDIR
jgi:hypothetical protein